MYFTVKYYCLHQLLWQLIQILYQNWKVSGDWFDVCKCNIPCPCEFAQAPTYGDCDGVLAYHIKKGVYGQTPLDGLCARCVVL